ncbi:hypothetical protein V3C33_04025 [Micrococcaceae bacterium Sec5.7]
MDDIGFELAHVDDGIDLVVKGIWTTACTEVLTAGHADGLVLNYALGYAEPDLDFLREWPIKRLKILDRSVTDLSPIYRLAATLRKLEVLTAPSATLDLSLLSGLQDLGAGWGQVRDTISDVPELKRIFVLYFDAPDLTVFKANPLLESIRMKDRPKIQSLKGFQDLTQLGELGIFRGSRLNDISGFDSTTENTVLHTLKLEACRKVTSLAPIRNLRSLKTLNIGDCGDIDSLHPLSSLQYLEELFAYGTTKVQDGDLSLLLALPRLRVVRIRPRKSYRPAVGEVENHVGIS